MLYEHVVLYALASFFLFSFLPLSFHQCMEEITCGLSYPFHNRLKTVKHASV